MKTKDELPVCPVATAVALVGGKWKLLIIRNLRVRPWRFNELQRDLEGISQKVLTDSLSQMMATLYDVGLPTAIYYDKNSATTRRFYATVQNKMHYAVHGHTAAEFIVERADHTKAHMGLTTWADAPEGKIKKSDVAVVKNYLSQDEMKQLNRMVTAYLDFAENMTLRHIPLTMQDWEKRLNSFIEMFDYGILQDAGKVSAEIAKLHAETEFEKYRVIQDRLFMSDFDKYMLEWEKNAKK